MNNKLYVVSVLVVILFWTSITLSQDVPSVSASLQGVVRSDAEGLMEGVLIRAKEAGGTITVTVVSDAQGQYRFPSNRLGSGTYQLSVRAAGYEVSGPAEVEVVASKTAQWDLKLMKTRDLVSQLMNAEWLLSVEMAGRKENVDKLSGCVGCHSLTRVMTSKHDANSWPAVLQRMNTYGAGGQKLPYDISTHPNTKYSSASRVDEEFAKYLSSINLSTDDKHAYDLKTFPRPTGRATRVVITEYDLPIDGFEPHEVLVDPEGMVWTTDFVGPNMLRMNSATGEFTAYEMPILKPGFPPGNNTLHLDKTGSLWWTGLKQGGIYKFDTKTKKFSAWMLPTGHSLYSHNGCSAPSPDGTVWANEQYLPQIQQLHPDTGKYTVYEPFPEEMTIVPAINPQPQGIGFLGGGSTLGPDYAELEKAHSMYGCIVDSKGTYYVADIGAGYIMKIDPYTKAVTLYQTPTPNSGPRKIRIDSQDRLWIGEYRAGKIAMFDTKTTEFNEWDLRTPYAGVYDADIDKAGDVWSGGMHTDYLYRLDPDTGEVTKYLLPSVNVNIRNMGGVDNRTTPVSIWVGENHQNKIARVEFLD